METQIPEDKPKYPLGVDIHEYEQIRDTLTGMQQERDFYTYEPIDSNQPESKDAPKDVSKEPTQQSVSSTNDDQNINLHENPLHVSLRSATTEAPTDTTTDMAHIPQEKIDEIVKLLNQAVDSLVTAGRAKKGEDIQDKNRSVPANTGKDSKKSHFFKNFRSIIGSEGSIKELPHSAKLTSSKVEIEDDFVFTPSNKEESHEKKILDKLERKNAKLLKRQNNIEAKIASMHLQLEKMESELEMEKANVRENASQILAKRLDLLNMKEKNDKETAEKEKIDRDLVEKATLEKEKSEKRKVDTLREEVKSGIEEVGHAQPQEPVTH